MKALVIQSSILGHHSTSRGLADHLVSRLAASEPALEVRTRDLGATPAALYDATVLGALGTPEDQRNEDQAALAAQSDEVIAEVFDADCLVFAVPVYNFGIPAQLKTYLDHLARAGVTFKYGADGIPVGLVQGKKVFVVSARGGKAEGTALDTVTPYLATMLGFLGMTDVTFVAAEGIAMGPDAAAQGVASARAKIDALLMPEGAI